MDDFIYPAEGSRRSLRGPTTKTPLTARTPNRPTPHSPAMVFIRLKEYMEAKGFVSTAGPKITRGTASVTLLSRLTGLTQATAFALLRYPDEVRAIQLDTIARICSGLGCKPSDFLIYRRDGRLPDATNARRSAMGIQ